MGCRQSSTRVLNDSDAKKAPTNAKTPCRVQQTKFFNRHFHFKKPIRKRGPADERAGISSSPVSTNTSPVGICSEPDGTLSKERRPPLRAVTTRGTQTPVWAAKSGTVENLYSPVAHIARVSPGGNPVSPTCTPGQTSSTREFCNTKIKVVPQPPRSHVQFSAATQAVQGDPGVFDLEEMEDEEDDSPQTRTHAEQPSYITKNPGKLPWRLEGGQWSQLGVGYKKELLLPVSPVASTTLTDSGCRDNGENTRKVSPIQTGGSASAFGTPGLASLVVSKACQPGEGLQFTTPCSRRAGRAVAAAAAAAKQRRHASCCETTRQNVNSNDFINWGRQKYQPQTLASNRSRPFSPRSSPIAGSNFVGHNSVDSCFGKQDSNSAPQTYRKEVDRGGEWTTFFPSGNIAFAGYPQLPQNRSNIENVVARRSNILTKRRSSCSDLDALASLQNTGPPDAKEHQDDLCTPAGVALPSELEWTSIADLVATPSRSSRKRAFIRRPATNMGPLVHHN